MSKLPVRYALIGSWFVVVASALYIYFFHGNVVRQSLSGAVSSSLVLGYVLYTLLSSLRGFTLIPSTYLIFIGVLLFPAWPLFICTLIGVVVSAACVYSFAESWHVKGIFASRHRRSISLVERFLKKYELPVVIVWSFLPFLPTDIICYVCGILKIDMRKFLFGVVLGEGVCCAIYIFMGHELLQLLHFI